MFLKLLLISYRHTGLFGAARENEEILLSLQQISNRFGADRGDLQKTNEARQTRRVQLERDWPGFESLSDREDLWTLMALDPQLNDDRELLRAMLNWFRYREAT